MRLRSAALALALLAACGVAGAPGPNRKDPADVARAFVAAFNARDLSAMLPLVDQVNLDAIKAALRDGSGSPAYEAIFAPQMVELLARQQGRVEGPRYQRRDAVMKVAESPDGYIYTVELEKTADETWVIVANAMMSAQEFASLPEKPRK